MRNDALSHYVPIQHQGYWDYPVSIYRKHPCPSCGHCPTCGRGGFGSWQFPSFPSFPYYEWQFPEAIVTGDAATNQTTLTFEQVKDKLSEAGISI